MRARGCADKGRGLGQQLADDGVLVLLLQGGGSKHAAHHLGAGAAVAKAEQKRRVQSIHSITYIAFSITMKRDNS